MQIHLLSGAIHSGKTTYLLEYAAKHQNCGGILTPVKEGKRFFYDLKAKEYKPMEAEINEQQILQIGKYTFSQNSFNWAIEKILIHASLGCDLLIIDEIGPLELQDKGFAAVVTQLLHSENPVSNLLLVVREQLVHQVCSHFKIKEQEITSWPWKSKYGR